MTTLWPLGGIWGAALVAWRGLPGLRPDLGGDAEIHQGASLAACQQAKARTPPLRA